MARGTWRVIAGLVLGAAAQTSTAHEHWVDAESFYPEAGQTVAVHLCSGHYFPQSSFALKDNVLREVVQRAPDGTLTPVATAADGKQRTGALTLPTEGTYVVRFVLQRPRAKMPSYEGNVILAVGDSGDSPALYATGAGLELVPEAPLATLRAGDTLPLTLRMDGQRVGAPLSASADGGRTTLLTARAEAPALLKLQTPGRYLVTSRYQGRGCSLMFMVRHGPRPATAHSKPR